jgi:hypothetical protein
MTIRRTSAHGGTYDAVIPVEGLLTFTRRSDGAQIVWNRRVDGFPIVSFDLVNVPWMDAPISSPPNDNYRTTSIQGLTTNFVAGYSSNGGRTNICGINLNISGLANPARSYHGHAATAIGSTRFFPSSGEECRQQAEPTPDPQSQGAVGLLLAAVGVVGIFFQRRRPRTSREG